MYNIMYYIISNNLSDEHHDCEVPYKFIVIFHDLYHIQPSITNKLNMINRHIVK